MSKMKRICLISLVIYLVVITSHLVLPPSPVVETYRSSVAEGGYKLSGTVALEKGGVTIFDYSAPLCISTGFFNMVSDSELSEGEVRIGVLDGEIPIERLTSWHVNWKAIALSYLPLWLVVACMYWLISRVRLELTSLPLRSRRLPSRSATPI